MDQRMLEVIREYIGMELPGLGPADPEQQKEALRKELYEYVKQIESDAKS